MREDGRPGAEWHALRCSSDWLAVGAGLRLEWPFLPGTDEIDPATEDMAVWLALFDLGVCIAGVIREPHDLVQPKNADRDTRNTVPIAPQWRYPVSDASVGVQVETGTPALILPVTSGSSSDDTRSSPARDFAEVLSLSEWGEEGFAAEIDDLVALPLDGGRPLSMTGYTLAIGAMRADHAGRLIVYGSGRAWLDVYLALVRKIAADTPPHLVERLHLPFPRPAPTLLVEPRALEWRVAQWRCVIPTDAKQIVCPDSRALAQQIDAAMRRKDRVRPLPTVCGPKEEHAA
jgi:hypothetical protein